LKQTGEQQKAALSSAIGLAIGMGIQNIPEGAAVALPIKEISGSALKGFLYGMFSGIVEPIFAILSLFISSSQKHLLLLILAHLPFLLEQCYMSQSKNLSLNLLVEDIQRLEYGLLLLVSC
jgi:hypothetical protein